MTAALVTLLAVFILAALSHTVASWSLKRWPR